MREVIWLLIVVLCVYVGFQLYRVVRLEKGTQQSPDAVRAAAHDDDELFVFERPAPVPPHITTVHAGERAAADRVDTSELPMFADELAAAQTSAAKASRPLTQPESNTASSVFEHTLEIHQLRREVDALREDLAEQRAETQRVQEALVGLREQLESAVLSQGISPEYNEALVLARRGLDVSDIAERCDISVAEAELVRALAQGGQREEGETT